MLLGDKNVNPGPNTVNNRKVPLHILSHFIVVMDQICLPNAIVLTPTKNTTIQKKSLHILHLNINDLLLKINEIRFIARQSHASLIGISESKPYSFILNWEVDTEDYDLTRMDHSWRGGGVAYYIRKPLSYNHK